MAGQQCPACKSTVDEQAVLCPQCGTALIPQMSKTQLSMGASHQPQRLAIRVTFFITLGLLLSAVVLSILIRGLGVHQDSLAGIAILSGVTLAVVGVTVWVGILLTGK